MATDATHSQPTSNSAPAAILSREEGVRRMDPSSAPSPGADRKPIGYGLPCAKCHLYYPADVDVCPTCHHPHRVSPLAPKIQSKASPAAAGPGVDMSKVEHEREEFLRQFKSQTLEAQAGAANASDSLCATGAQHPSELANAEFCKLCYEKLQERVDICEGSLHMDLKEAAQIIYDAVWADPSDPTKTYQNAASALLSEMRKRAGVITLRGPFQPLSD